MNNYIKLCKIIGHEVIYYFTDENAPEELIWMNNFKNINIIEVFNPNEKS